MMLSAMSCSVGCCSADHMAPMTSSMDCGPADLMASRLESQMTDISAAVMTLTIADTKICVAADIMTSMVAGAMACFRLHDRIDVDWYEGWTCIG